MHGDARRLRRAAAALAPYKGSLKGNPRPGAHCWPHAKHAANLAPHSHPRRRPLRGSPQRPPALAPTTRRRPPRGTPPHRRTRTQSRYAAGPTARHPMLSCALLSLSCLSTRPQGSCALQGAQSWWCRASRYRRRRCRGCLPPRSAPAPAAGGAGGAAAAPACSCCCGALTPFVRIQSANM